MLLYILKYKFNHIAIFYLSIEWTPIFKYTYLIVCIHDETDRVCQWFDKSSFFFPFEYGIF